MEVENGVSASYCNKKNPETQYLRRYKTLKMEFLQIERENFAIFSELRNSRLRVERLKFERSLLFERLRDILASERFCTKKHSKGFRDSEFKSSGLDRYKSSIRHHMRHYLHKGRSCYSRNQNDDNYEKLTSKLNTINSWDIKDTTSEMDFENNCSDRIAPGESIDENYFAARDENLAPLFSKKSKRQKPKDRDPNAPKRPSNAFMYFCEMQREILKKERETLDEKQQEKAGLNNLTKALGSRWQALTDDERREWKEQFLAEVERYDREMKYYRDGAAVQVVESSQFPSKNATLQDLNYSLHCDYKEEENKPKITDTESESFSKDNWSQEAKKGEFNGNFSQDKKSKENEGIYEDSASFTGQSELSEPDLNMLENLDSDSPGQDAGITNTKAMQSPEVS